MKFAVSPSPHLWWRNIKDLELWISEVESCGYDAVLIPDHYNLPVPDFPSNELLDAWSMLSFIAARTERIKIGTCVTPIPRYVPSQLAKVIATVDVLSEGRVIAGFGAGWYLDEFINYSPHGLFDEPKVRVEKFLEGLQIITRLWMEDNVTFNGKYYKLKNTVLFPKPKQKPHPPLWLGGLGSFMLKTAAKYFNAWLPPRSRPRGEIGALTPEKYEQGVNTIKAHLKEYNRNINAFTFALLGWITDDVNLIEKYVQAGCQYYVVDITPYVSSSNIKHAELIRKFAEDVMPLF